MQESQVTSQGTSEADILINLLIHKGFRFFLDQYGEACLVDPEKSFTAVKLDSDSAQSVLAKEYWNEYHKAVTKGTISKACYTLRGLTEMEGHKESVHTRVAQLGDQIIYDLGDDKRVVIITHNGWNITENSPVFFRRFSHQQIQVTPIGGGNLMDFLQFLNVHDETSKLLILTYLPTALFSEIERPILLLHGPEGSGKSTCFGFIRSMIDPSIMESLDMKKNTDELAIQANEHYCFFIDNVSYLNQEMSNTICRFTTGEYYAKRKLYTNDSTVMMSFKRLIGLNGITQFASAPDLLDRTIIINLRRLNNSERAGSLELKKRFEELKPLLFGALLDIVSYSLAHVSEINAQRQVRLSDSYKFSCASALKLGFSLSDFENSYKQNVDLQKEESLEASPVASIIRTFVENYGDWSGPSARLYGALLPVASQLRLEKSLPHFTPWLIRRIKTIENALYCAGIGIEVAKVDGERSITIKKLQQDSTDSILQETTEQEVA